MCCVIGVLCWLTDYNYKLNQGVKCCACQQLLSNCCIYSTGIINRADSEKLLESKSDGSFLVRVSERVWGYTLSYKQGNRYKHFLIDASDYGYQFFGADQTVHTSLAELVKFHKVIIGFEIEFLNICLLYRGEGGVRRIKYFYHHIVTC